MKLKLYTATVKLSSQSPEFLVSGISEDLYMRVLDNGGILKLRMIDVVDNIHFTAQIISPHEPVTVPDTSVVNNSAYWRLCKNQCEILQNWMRAHPGLHTSIELALTFRVSRTIISRVINAHRNLFWVEKRQVGVTSLPSYCLKSDNTVNMTTYKAGHRNTCQLFKLIACMQQYPDEQLTAQQLSQMTLLNINTIWNIFRCRSDLITRHVYGNNQPMTAILTEKGRDMYIPKN